MFGIYPIFLKSKRKMIDFFKNLNEFVVILAALVTGITALIGAITLLFKQQSKKQTDTNAKIENFITEHDRVQNDKIDKLDGKTDKLEELIKELSSKMDKVNVHLEEDAFKKNLRSKINMKINSFLDVNSDLDTPMQSMVTEGGKQAYLYFRDLYEVGVANMPKEAMKRGAIQVFRSLRSGVAGERNIDPEFVRAIKVQVAYPLINELIEKFMLFEQSYYNGKTPEEFSKIALWFIDTLLSRTIALYRKNEK